MVLAAVSIILASILVFRALIFIQGSLKVRSAVQKLPCPPGAHWLVGHIRQGPFSPGYKWLRDTVQAFPRAYTLWLGPVAVAVLVHPDTLKPLMLNTTGSVKSSFYKLYGDWVGEGLATSDGAKWGRNRRLLTGSFHFEFLRTYVPVYNDCVEVLLGKMDQLAAKGKPMKVDHELGLCTFDIILRTACSHQSNCQLAQPPTHGELDYLSATDTLTRVVQERKTGNPLLLSPLMFRFGFPSLYAEWTKACRFVHRVAEERIEQRKKEISEKVERGEPISKPRDFLDTILLARDADGTGLTVKEITDEVNTFLSVGHETTSTALNWLMYILARYPEQQTKIRDEVDEILAGRASDFITSKDLSRMEHMSLVIKETLRLYPPAMLPSRTLTEPYEVDGVTLPAGTTVAVNLYQLHHNPTVWGDDHMEFRPSRFLPENFTKMDPFAYLPFSAGPRNCIGQQFASNQMKVLVARILRRFSLSLVEGEPEPIPNLTIATKPLHELLVTLEPRNM